MAFTDITCPKCNAPVKIDVNQEEVICTRCGYQIAKKRAKHLHPAFSWGCIVFFIILSIYMGTSSESTNKIKNIEYDVLQKLFLSLSLNTTHDDFEKSIQVNNLKFEKTEFSGAGRTEKYTIVLYKVAYSDDVAKFRFARGGDSMEIGFDKKDGLFLYAIYNKYPTWKNALLYNCGLYSFGRREKNNRYSGYYYFKSGDDDSGIVIEHNGKNSKSGYHPCASAEEALAYVLE